jgi:hypothetical protein
MREDKKKLSSKFSVLSTNLLKARQLISYILQLFSLNAGTQVNNKRHFSVKKISEHVIKNNKRKKRKTNFRKIYKGF